MSAKKHGKPKNGDRNKSTPRNVSQWAADAYQALEKALIAFEQEYPSPSEEERLELIGFASELAADARGVTDLNLIDDADEYAVDNVLADLESMEELTSGDDEGQNEPEYMLLFLLCYLDVHVAFGLLKEDELEAIMAHLVEHYELESA